MVLAVGCLNALSPAQKRNSSQKESALTPKELFKLRHDSVVTVITDQGEGTGFIVKNGLLVATCYHVIRDAKNIEVQGTNNTKWSVGAVYFDKDNDAAILKLTEDSKRTPIPVGDLTKMSPGDEVFVIGNPLGLEQSITNGILSAKRKLEGVDVIQMTAAISPGSSGSPLFNNLGQFIGFVSFHFKDSQMVNMAIAAPAIVQLWQEPPIPIQTFYASAKKETIDDDDDSKPEVPEKPKFSPAEAQKLFENQFPTLICEIADVILQWKVDWYVESARSPHNVSKFTKDSKESYGLLLTAFEHYPDLPDIIESLDVTAIDKEKITNSFVAILDDGLKVLDVRSKLIDNRVSNGNIYENTKSMNELNSRITKNLEYLLDYYRIAKGLSYGQINDLMDPCLAYSRMLRRLKGFLPDPRHRNECIVGFAPTDTGIGPGEKILAIRRSGESKWTFVDDWQGIQKFIYSLPSEVKTVVIMTEKAQERQVMLE